MERECIEGVPVPDEARAIVRAIIRTVSQNLLGMRLSNRELRSVELWLESTIVAIAQDAKSRLGGVLQGAGKVGHGARAKLSPPQLARLWGISPDKVLNWIRSGELRAINVASTRGRRPRYLIDRADVQAFEMRRAVIAATPLRRRNKPRSNDVIEFF